MKIKVFATAVVGLLAAVATFNINSNSVKTSASDPAYDNIPELGDISADSYITSIWNDPCGARRIDDRGVIVNDVSAWGWRAQIAGRKFDIGSFYITIDMEKIGNEQAAMLIFGSGAGSYDTSDNELFVMDIVKARNVNDLFLVTCSVGANAHNISIPTFTDGKVWEDNSQYQGVTVSAADYKISIKFEKGESTTKITLNDVVVDVNNDELYEKCVDGTEAYFACGLYNGGDAAYSYIINTIGDASDDVYFSAEGTFGTCKSEIAALKDESFEGYTVEQVLAVKDRYDAIPYSDLYSWDKEYFSEDWTTVTTKVDEAVDLAGAKIKFTLYERTYNSLKEIIDSLNGTDVIDNAIDLYNQLVERQEDVEEVSGQLDPDDCTKYKDYCTDADTFVNKIKNAASEAIKTAVTNYENQVELGVANADDILALQKVKKAIPHRYSDYLDDGEYDALLERIEKVDDKVKELTTIVHDNWEQGANAKTVEKADGSLDLVTAGDSQFASKEDSSGIYCSEEISAVNFDLDINFKYIPDSVGGWVTFGIMENPGMWVYAEDDSVQNNKGIFFLITKINSQTLGVQCFMCSLTSNRFYDSVITQTIQIPSNTDLHIEFREVEKEIAGVKDTYFNMDFNGTSFDQTNITARKIKTILMTKTGYFMLASAGYGASDPAVVTINSINGVKPLSASIKKTETKDLTPTSTTTETSFVNGSEAAKPSFNLDTKDQAITSVTVDGNEVDAANYTYSNNKLTFTNAYANTLSVGDHVVKVTTAGGSVQWTLHVLAGEDPTPDPDPDPTPSKGGCGSSVIASSIVMSILAVAGIGLVLRKKED